MTRANKLSNTASPQNCFTSCHCVEPRILRIPTSRKRDEAMPRERLVKLTQAMSNTAREIPARM